ncbi:fibronectin type III domain-containing protein [Bacillus pretiosus]|uniref:fibronectin type III domain-containing protein n=1 Tax=Bacillus pretiosus TaxID=2983392 RepID=UPI003D662D96
MRFKKYLAVFSLMMIMCLSVLPSFASANTIDKPYVASRDSWDWHLCSEKVCVSPSSIKPGETFYYDLGLGKDVEWTSIYLKFYSDSFLDDSFITFYDVNKKEVAKHYLEGISNNDNLRYDLAKKYSASYVSITNNGSSIIDIYRFTLSFNGGGSEYVFPLKMSNITEISSVSGVNDVTFSWKNPDSEKYTGLRIYQDGKLLTMVDKKITSFKADNLEGNKNYLFKFAPVYGEREIEGIEKSVKTLIDPKTVPPSPVSSLTAEPTDKTVKLKWKKPKDDDLEGFKILQNGKQVAEIGLQEEFTVKNLKPLTDYKFDVIAFDKDKNDSSPVSLSVKTLEEKDDVPPHVPSNVDAKPSNGALIASWDKVSDKDLAGYNVYVDGKKINGNLITSTTFVIKNLENSKKYKIQVQAVDRSGNASGLSLAAFGTPDVNTIPVIENDYSVKDVSEGVGTMFSGLWLALAFAVSIPLAFYVIYKLKQTILS